MPAGIYTLLDQGRAFDSPAELLRAVGLYDLTQQSMVCKPQLARPDPLAAMRAGSCLQMGGRLQPCGWCAHEGLRLPALAGGCFLGAQPSPSHPHPPRGRCSLSG